MKANSKFTPYNEIPEYLRQLKQCNYSSTKSHILINFLVVFISIAMITMNCNLSKDVFKNNLIFGARLMSWNACLTYGGLILVPVSGGFLSITKCSSGTPEMSGFWLHHVTKQSGLYFQVLYAQEGSPTSALLGNHFPQKI